MNKSPTSVIFLWHMHQPFYKHPEKNYYVLPWVRLHGIKDYYGMARLVKKFEKIKMVFNFSGVLLSQLLDYANNKVEDYYGILTLKDPNSLKEEDRNFIIDRFFSVNFERFIRPNQRYLQLYNKRLSAGKSHFTIHEIGDLQLLFNLCWFHPYSLREDKHLQGIINKGKNYTLDDKKYVIDKQYDIITEILPLYKKLLDDNRIELSVTPFYHPIMPLIYNTDIIQETTSLKPPMKFSAPNDCHWHLKKAKSIFNDCFGCLPQGSWPSEGGISQDAVSLYVKERFKWIATDESLLFKSLISDYVSYEMIKNQRHLIYRPYKYKGVNVFFRDKNLSDAISFIYQGWDDSGFAARDLVEHFKRIHRYAGDILKERAIIITMDGENAWEYYKNNGVEFLETTYSALETNPSFITETASEFLKKTESKDLHKLASGSWVNADFDVWAGSDKNNNYWHILRKIKDMLDKSKKRNSNWKKAKEYLFVLEGSDWFWWNTFEDVTGEYKKLFSLYIEKIHSLLKEK